MDFKLEKQHLTLRGQVEEKIKAAIRVGHFKPGDRLVERELCELLDVSRTSIREALRHLEAQGLIQTVPHKGPIVSVITADEARQLYELRALLEGFAGAKFAESGSPEDKAALEEAVQHFENVVKSSSQEDWLEAKAGFYDLLLRGSGNAFVAQALESLYDRITLLRNRSMSKPGRLEKSIEELWNIVRAIQAGDSKLAGEACRLHIANAASAALSGQASSV